MIYIISDIGVSLEQSKSLAALALAGDSDQQIFPIIQHPIDPCTALVIENLYYDVLVHPNADPNIFASLMGYTIPQDIINIINAVKIEQVPPAPPSGYELGRFAFNDVVEGFLTTHDNQYMVDNGWFE